MAAMTSMWSLHSEFLPEPYWASLFGRLRKKTQLILSALFWFLVLTKKLASCFIYMPCFSAWVVNLLIIFHFNKNSLGASPLLQGNFAFRLVVVMLARTTKDQCLKESFAFSWLGILNFHPAMRMKVRRAFEILFSSTLTHRKNME